MKPRALDLFCGAGGATRGLQVAGFHVTGVDHKPQPRYCGDAFVQADALGVGLVGFNFIWASPPCLRWTRGRRDGHGDLIEDTRRHLQSCGALYCIENVNLAPLRTTVILTGEMFGLRTYRKRKFETNFLLLTPRHGRPFGPQTRADAVTVAGNSGGKSNRDGWQNGCKAAWQAAMGIDWMNNLEMAQAVPPAYAEFIGREARRYIEAAAPFARVSA